jgi:hypothetical protein
MENPLVVFVSSVVAGMEAERAAVRAAMAAERLRFCTLWSNMSIVPRTLCLATHFLKRMDVC